MRESYFVVMSSSKEKLKLRDCIKRSVIYHRTPSGPVTIAGEHDEIQDAKRSPPDQNNQGTDDSHAEETIKSYQVTHLGILYVYCIHNEKKYIIL